MKLDQLLSLMESPRYLKRNPQETKEQALQLVILLRMIARESINLYNQARDRAIAAKRLKRLSKDLIVSFPMYENHIKILDTKAKEYHDIVVMAGESLMSALDSWQDTGASFSELCNLCSVSAERAAQEVGPEIHNQFSSIIFVYNLDYKGSGDLLLMEEDAPLTHSIKEYMLDRMINTKEGRNASDQAIKEVFPEIWENALTLYRDEEGNGFFVDENGDFLSEIDFSE